MTRIVAADRQRIENLAYADTIGKEKKEWAAREAALFKKIFERMVPKKTRDMITELGKEWVRGTSSINVNAGGYQVCFTFTEFQPTKWGAWGTINLTDQDLIDEVRKFNDERETFVARCNQGLRALQNMLKNASTFERLKASWPEGKAYWEPVWIDATKKQLPALDVKSVNDALGLPKDPPAPKPRKKAA